MRFRIGMILASALTVAAGACASGGGGGETTPSTPQGEVLSQGVQPTENEHTEEAEDQLEAAEDAATPEAARPHFQAALEAAEQAIALDERNPLPHLQAARAHLGLGNYVEAGQEFDRAEELRPIYTLQTTSIREQTWINLYQEAAPYVNSGEYERAAEIFEQANAIYAERPEVMITLGQIYGSLGETDKAIENLRRAREIIESDRITDMDSATAAQWRSQGEQIPEIMTQALLQARRYEEAAEELRGILADDPDNLQYLQLLGNVYAQTGQADSARVIFDRILDQPGLGNLQLYQIAVGLYQMEEWLEAADAFEMAAERSAMDRDALEMLTRSLQIAYQEMGDSAVTDAQLEDLVDAAERWIEVDPYSRNAKLILAQTVNQMGQAERARELIEQIESMPFTVDQLQLRRRQGGGGSVTGQVTNQNADPGTTVTLDFTFYNEAGTPVASETATVSLPAQEASEVIQLEFESGQDVAGYSYEVQM